MAHRIAFRALGATLGGSTTLSLAHYTASGTERRVEDCGPSKRVVDGGLLFPQQQQRDGSKRVVDGGLLFLHGSPSQHHTAAGKPRADCPMCGIVEARAVLWEDEDFLVAQHFNARAGTGYLFLISKRHYQGPSSMSTREAASVGPILRKCERALEAVTGCDRVYTAALGSPAAPHFHAHMVPVFDGRPGARVTGTPFDAFLQDWPVDAALQTRVARDFAAAMA